MLTNFMKKLYSYMQKFDVYFSERSWNPQSGLRPKKFNKRLQNYLSIGKNQN